MPNTLERTPIQNQIYAKTLLDAGASIRSVAKRLNMGKDTVTAIARQQSYSASQLEEFKRRLPFKAYKLADDVLDLVDRDEIKKAPLNVKMMTFGIAVDKARDMEGSNRPVFNIVNVVGELNKSLNELQAKQAALLALQSE